MASIMQSFWKISFWGNVISTKYKSGQVYILENKFWGKRNFGQMKILASVKSAK